MLWIIAATAVATLFSISAAAWFSFALLARVVERMVAFSVGILLGAALLHMLPEAFESGVDPHALFALFLLAVLMLFGLERLAIFRHSHHHEHDGHHHDHGFDRSQAGRGGRSILLADGLHKFADGVLIAAAFLADIRLGLIAAASIIAHEIPQEIGDFLVLLNAGLSRRRAYLYSVVAGTACVAGGVFGWVFLDRSKNLIPYALIVASASFIYIALSDLMPQLQRESRRGESFWHIALVGIGIATIYAVFSSLQTHAH